MGIRAFDPQQWMGAKRQAEAANRAEKRPPSGVIYHNRANQSSDVNIPNVHPNFKSVCHRPQAEELVFGEDAGGMGRVT